MNEPAKPWVDVAASASIEDQFALVREQVFTRSADARPAAEDLHNKLALLTARTELLAALAGAKVDLEQAKPRVREAAFDVRQFQPTDAETVLDLAAALVATDQSAEAVTVVLDAMRRHADVVDGAYLASFIELLFDEGRTSEAEQLAISMLQELALSPYGGERLSFLEGLAAASDPITPARRRFLEELLSLTERRLRSAPDDLALLRLRAVSLVDLGRLPDGLVLVEQILDRVPTDAAARWIEVVALARLQRYPEALDRLDRLPAPAPGRPEVLTLRIRLLANAGRHEEGVASAEAAVAAYPEQVDVRLAQAEVLLAAGRASEALQAIDALLSNRPGEARLLVMRANVLRNLGRLADAVDTLQEAVERNPQDARAYAMLGERLVDSERIEEGLAALDRALALAPDLGDLWFERASILQRLGRYIEALEMVEAALDRGKEGHEVFGLRGEILTALQRYDEAATWYQKALVAASPAEDPGVSRRYIQALQDTASSLVNAGRNDLALECLNWLQKEGKLDAYGMGLRAETLRLSARYHEAIEQANAALATAPNMNWAILSKAAALIQLLRSQEGLELLDQALASDPTPLFGWSAYVVGLDQLEQVTQALRILNEHFPDGATPDNWAAWALTARAQVLIDLARFSEAVELLERALTREELANWRAPLGMAYNRLGQPQDAIDSLRFAIQLAGDNLEAWTRIELGDALTLHHGRQSAEASATYRYVVERQPPELTPRDLVLTAWAQFRLGTVTKAIAGYRTALTKATAPMLVERLRLVLILYVGRATKEAETELDRALHATATLQDRARADAILAETRYVLGLLRADGTLAEVPPDTIERLAARLRVGTSDQAVADLPDKKE